jgi:hypothetical protein
MPKTFVARLHRIDSLIKKKKYKKHESDHAGWNNGIQRSIKIKHN